MGGKVRSAEQKTEVHNVIRPTSKTKHDDGNTRANIDHGLKCFLHKSLQRHHVYHGTKLCLSTPWGKFTRMYSALFDEMAQKRPPNSNMNRPAPHSRHDDSTAGTTSIMYNNLVVNSVTLRTKSQLHLKAEPFKGQQPLMQLHSSQVLDNATNRIQVYLRTIGVRGDRRRHALISMSRITTGFA